MVAGAVKSGKSKDGTLAAYNLQSAQATGLAPYASSGGYPGVAHTDGPGAGSVKALPPLLPQSRLPEDFLERSRPMTFPSRDPQAPGQISHPIYEDSVPHSQPPVGAHHSGGPIRLDEAQVPAPPAPLIPPIVPDHGPAPSMYDPPHSAGPPPGQGYPNQPLPRTLGGILNAAPSSPSVDMAPMPPDVQNWISFGWTPPHNRRALHSCSMSLRWIAESLSTRSIRATATLR